MNLNRIVFLLLFSLLFFFNPAAEAQRYTVDQGPTKKVEFNIVKAFHRNPAKKANREEEKKKRRAAKYDKKAIKKYWKTLDNPEEVKTNRKVYKRMKQNLKKASRINEGRHPDPLFKRIFAPKRETKRVKNNNEKPSRFRLWKKKA